MNRWEREGERGPKSEFARYAYGYSDKKPGWTFYFFPAIMVGIMLCMLFGCACGPYYAEDRIYDQDLRFPQRAAWVHIEGRCTVKL